jgi:hypothetical protein
MRVRRELIIAAVVATEETTVGTICVAEPLTYA